jgi:hypothetical protein
VDAARELRELRRIERWLTINDPELAAMLAAHGTTPAGPKHRWMRLAVDAVGTVSVVIGMLTGVLTVAFIGVLVLMTGACLHTTCRRQRRRGPASP